MKVDLNYFPGWVRKCMTFTIDDGNVVLDRKFMDYVKPAGIKGTFNLTTPLRSSMTADDYKKLYRGFEIANHCRLHPYPFAEDRKVVIKDEMFDRAKADRRYAYLSDEEGIYWIYTYDWTRLADDRRYMECVDSCQKELEGVFGKGRIRGYVWPNGEQKNKQVFEALKAYGFQSIRATGCVLDKTGFALPSDRARWSYNANYTCLCETGRLYDEYPDDGELKFFCFGVHSHDFENNGKWDELAEFCDRYGNRPETFWYASVGEIFDYEDAVKSVRISEGLIENPSEVDLAIVVDGKRLTLGAGESIRL